MKTLKVLLQEVVSGIKAWVNSNFAQESNTVHKTGNETVNGVKTFSENIVVKRNDAAKLFLIDTRADRTYDAEQTTESASRIEIVDKDNVLLNRISSQFNGNKRNSMFFTNYTEDTNGNQISRDLMFNLSPESCYFYPAQNDAINLGAASAQWNNLYAKNYFYNGTAWGLDKNNVWSGRNDFKPNFVTVNSYRFRIKDQSMILGTVPSSNQWTGMQFVDKNETPISEIVQSFQSNGNSLYQINVYPNEANSVKRSVIAYAYNSANNVNTLQVISDLLPNINNTYELGRSNQKWKTFNGLNPGVLSLPDLSDPDPVGTSTWITQTPTNNSYTPSEDGWLNVVASHASSSNFSVYIKSGDFYASTYFALEDIDDNTFKSGLFVPVLAGQTYYIVFKGGLSNITVDATFYPAKGNV